MKSAALRMTCRFLVRSMMVTAVGAADAGMIAVDQFAEGPSQTQRIEVASELQARGVDPRIAGERVAAMTDAEVQSLEGEIDALPAGGFGGVLVSSGAIVFLFALAAWYFFK